MPVRATVTLSLLAALLLLPAVPAVADHTEQRSARCDGGFCSDGEHRILDCSAGDGTCTGPGAAFPTIVNPAYGQGGYLSADDLVLGVAMGQTPKAYPVQVMNYFETIEETFDGEPSIVTYCPLCGSGIVWDREVKGETFQFLNTGAIWQNDLVMYDRETASWWSQIGGEAIKGPLHGWTLELMPSTIVTWADWKEEHPDTLVLQRPRGQDGGFLAPYEKDPYASYKHSERTVQGRSTEDSTGLHPKTRVAGIKENGEAYAFPLEEMRQAKVVETSVGGLEVVAGMAGNGVHIWERGNRSFQPGPENGTMVDQAGTVWSITTGESRDGLALDAVAAESLYWFAWLDFHPETGVYLADGTPSPASTQPPAGAEQSAAPGFELLSMFLALLGAGFVAGRARREQR